jgi:cold-inducible RNA-binding protein
MRSRIRDCPRYHEGDYSSQHEHAPLRIANVSVILDPIAQGMSTEEAMSKLFVGNLSFKVTDADLKNWVESNGYPVESAQVMSDHKTGRSRGIGFVILKRNDQLKDAIAKLNGQSFNDRTVNVEEAKSPASNEGPHPQKRGRW